FGLHRSPSSWQVDAAPQSKVAHEKVRQSSPISYAEGLAETQTGRRGAPIGQNNVDVIWMWYSASPLLSKALVSKLSAIPRLSKAGNAIAQRGLGRFVQRQTVPINKGALRGHL